MSLRSLEIGKLFQCGNRFLTQNTPTRGRARLGTRRETKIAWVSTHHRDDQYDDQRDSSENDRVAYRAHVRCRAGVFWKWSYIVCLKNRHDVARARLCVIRFIRQNLTSTDSDKDGPRTERVKLNVINIISVHPIKSHLILYELLRWRILYVCQFIKIGNSHAAAYYLWKTTW